MPRKKRQLNRDIGTLRDAKMIIIASEDEFAVKQYFEHFQQNRITFAVLPTEDGKSAPQHVMARMKQYRIDNDLDDEDVYWLVCDTDRWTRPNTIQATTAVLTECKQKGIQVAFSKPSFEIWLLMHFSDEIDETWTVARNVEKAIRASHGSYNKKRVDLLTITNEAVQHAIRVSKTRDVAPNTIPEKPGSAVHHIIEELFSLGIIQVAPKASPMQHESTVDDEADE